MDGKNRAAKTKQAPIGACFVRLMQGIDKFQRGLWIHP